jgi:membrane protein DedA with SNARE-associated domain
MLIHLLDRLLAEYGVVLVGVVVALEAMGLPLPGESMVIGGAIYCATTHKQSIGWMLTAAIVGAIMGDNAGYLIGRSLGFRLLAKYGRRIGLSDERLLLGRYLFVKYGGVVVFTGRFVAVLRTFAALLAGANRMSWPRFMAWNALGGIVWAGGYGLAAYFLGKEIERLQGWLGLGLGTVILGVIIVSYRYLKRNEQRLIDEAKEEASRLQPV